MARKNNSEFIDFRGMFEEYKKHWWWFVISVIVCVGLAFVYTKIKKPEYMVRANVLVIDDNTSAMTSMSGLDDLFGSRANVEDEVFVVNSHSVLRDVARDLGINEQHYVSQGFLQKRLAYPNYPVTVHTTESLCDTLLTTIVFKTKIHKNGTADVEARVKGDVIADIKDSKLPVSLSTDYGKFVVDTTRYYKKGEELKSTISLSGYDVAAEDLSESVTSDKASKKSNIVELYMTTTNLEYGEDVLDKIIEIYNIRAIESKNEQGQRTLDFINERLQMITGDLTAAESDIQTYKQNNGIVDVAAEATYNMSKRASAEAALVNAQTQSEIIKMTRDFLSQPENAYELIPGSGEIPAASSAIASYNEMVLKRTELMQNARGNNKVLGQMNEQLDMMREAINTSLDRAYETSLVAIREARAAASRAMGKLGNIPVQEREFLNLQRQQQVKQQLYLFLLQRREETAMVIANAVPKGRIIDEAYTLSEPLGLKKIVILILAMMFGLLIPPVILYVKKLFRNKFETRKEVEQLTDVPVLGEICTDHSGQTLVVETNNTSSTAELFRMVRSSLQFMLNEETDKVVLITSTRSGEGKSYISVNLAASLALLGKKVVLVGMDIRNPQLANYLNLSQTRGVTNFLSSSSETIDNILIHEPLVKNLDIIVAGPIPPNPGELLVSHRVEEFVGELRERYDYVIIDSAPVGMVSDTFNLARISDATVYVCRVNYTTLHDIDFLNEVYDEKRLRRPALVVNGTTASRGYGYGYGRKSSDN